jgi:hypothetical protein
MCKDKYAFITINGICLICSLRGNARALRSGNEGSIENSYAIEGRLWSWFEFRNLLNNLLLLLIAICVQTDRCLRIHDRGESPTSILNEALASLTRFCYLPDRIFDLSLFLEIDWEQKRRWMWSDRRCRMRSEDANEFINYWTLDGHDVSEPV